MAKITKEKVYAALKECFDPEMPVSIVDLGLIYDVEISADNIVKIKMTLTSPGCPLASRIAIDAEARVKKVPGVKDCIVNIVWEPLWNHSMMSKEAKIKLGFGVSEGKNA